MSSGITFSGLSSGLDISGIITQLVNLEKAPLQRYQTQKATLQQSSNVYSAFKSKITSFTSSLTSLNQASTFNPMQASTSDSTVATVSTTSNTSAGIYELTVKKLAQTHKISSSAKTDTTSALSLSGTFSVNGKEVSVESSDSLTTIAQKINTADAKVTASVINGGTDKAYLTLSAQSSGASNAISVTDGTGGVLAALGNFGTTLSAAQDAEFTLDGLNLTSSTNSVTSVIPGASITLLKANTDLSAKTTISVSKDMAGLKSKMKEFQTAYNGVIQFIRDYSAFDAETYSSGPLFGNSAAGQVEAALNSTVFESVGSGTIKNLAQLGFTVTDKGLLEFNETEFDETVSANFSAVQGIFAASGTGSTSALRYVSSSNKTVAGDYSVNITQAATQSTGTAGTAQTGTSGGGENITFSGSLFGSSTFVLTTTGGTASDLVTQINNDSRLRDLLVASLDNDGKLSLKSKTYGTASAFTVTSNQAASTENSGIGTAGLSVTTGLNVAGTINGEAATGSGQFLLGNSDNATTDGLQVMYTGTTTGSVGTMSFVQGLAQRMDGAMTPFTDSVNGLLKASDDAIQSQISDLDDKMTRLNETLTAKETYLRTKFAAMEEAMGKMQSQASSLTSMLSSFKN